MAQMTFFREAVKEDNHQCHNQFLLKNKYFNIWLDLLS